MDQCVEWKGVVGKVECDMWKGPREKGGWDLHLETELLPESQGGWEVRDKLSVITGERMETCVYAAVGPKELE